MKNALNETMAQILCAELIKVMMPHYGKAKIKIWWPAAAIFHSHRCVISKRAGCAHPHLYKVNTPSFPFARQVMIRLLVK